MSCLSRQKPLLSPAGTSPGGPANLFRSRAAPRLDLRLERVVLRWPIVCRWLRRMPIEEDELYQERILDHYEEPYHRGACPGATHAHEDENPLCGDQVRIELAIDPDGTVRDAYFNGDGCCISQASASMLL